MQGAQAGVTGLPLQPVSTKAGTWAGSADGCSCRYCAATPLTCGHAMEVPVALIVALGVVYLQTTRLGLSLLTCESNPVGVYRAVHQHMTAALPHMPACTHGP
jgi:hypothetical protein